MPEESAAPPFKWSEIHDQVEKKIPELVNTIRAEIGTAVKPVPPPGRARQRFFVLLDENATGWAKRASRVYMDCLQEIGRVDAPEARRYIWSHGLYFFITENLRELMFLACGIGPREKELMRTPVSRRPYSSRGWGTPSKGTDLRSIVHGINVVLENVRARMEQECIQPIPVDLAQELPAANKPSSEFSKRDRHSENESQANAELKSAKQPVTNSKSPSSNAERRKLLQRKLENAGLGATFTFDEAAEFFGVTLKTIREWIGIGKLSKGAKRSTVTVASIRRLAEGRN